MSAPAATKRPSEMDVRIGARLAVLREQAGLSQDQLKIRLEAVGINLSQAQLSHYERGRNKVPASLLAASAPILRCDVGAFFDPAVTARH